MYGINIKFDRWSKPYSYAVKDEIKLAEGDLCVIPALTADGLVYKVVKVVEVLKELPASDTIKYRWVICKVDFTHTDENTLIVKDRQ